MADIEQFSDRTYQKPLTGNRSRRLAALNRGGNKALGHKELVAEVVDLVERVESGSLDAPSAVNIQVDTVTFASGAFYIDTGDAPASLGIEVGMNVSGPGIQEGSVVDSIEDPGNGLGVNLSLPTTAEKTDDAPVYFGREGLVVVGDLLAAIDEAATQATAAATEAAEALIDASRGQGADVASATTIDLDAVVGESCDVTGTTTITAVTLASGRSVLVRFTGILTLTHSATLVLPNATNITTEAGDYLLFQGYAGGVVRAVIYSPATVPADMKPGYYRNFSAAQWAAHSPVGAGASSGVTDFGVSVFGPSTAVGYATRYNSPGTNSAICRGKNVGVIDWSKTVEIQFTMLIFGSALHANCVARVSVGKTTADLAGTLARAGVSIGFTGTGAMVVRLHNGTTGTDTTTSFTYTVGQAFDVRLVSNGGGTTYVWVNDTSLGAATGGPTTDGASGACLNQFEVENTGITTTQGIITVSDFSIRYGR